MAGGGDGLKEALAQLRRAGLSPRTASALRTSSAKLRSELFESVKTSVPAYHEFAQAEVADDMRRHGADHVEEILRLLEGGDVGAFAFVREHAGLRAEQRFPLEAALQALRCGHRVVSHWLRAGLTAARVKPLEAAVSAAVDFSIEYTDAISAVLTAEYVGRTRALAAAESDHRADVLNALLAGRGDAGTELTLKREGYLAPRLVFCAALAQSADPSEMQSAPRVQRVVEAMSAALASLKVRTVIGVRDRLVVAVIADFRRKSGWEAPTSDLSERVRRALLMLGPSVMIGLSREHPGIAEFPRAREEAQIALGCAGVVDRVVPFAGLTLRRLALHRAGDFLRSAPPPWVATFHAADAKAGGAFSEALRAYADADMNALKASAALGLHPNTLYARMHRIHDLTGLQVGRYHDLTDLLLAADVQAAS